MSQLSSGIRVVVIVEVVVERRPQREQAALIGGHPSEAFEFPKMG